MVMSEVEKGYLNTNESDGVMTIEICNATRFNAMSLSMWEHLADVVLQAEQSTSVRAIVLTGSGDRAFVSGADISEFGHLRNDPAQVARYDRAVSTAQRALSEVRHPTIAVIRGICMGGGMGLSLACDLRYCTDDSRFRMPAAKLGLGYARDGIKRMREVLGSARSAELFMTARTFDGIEAARMGIVQEVFPRADFDTIVAQRIAAIAGNAPLTIQAAKLALRHLAGGNHAPSAEAVDAATGACFLSHDYQEGQLAFREKRPPVFTGQ
jgi:enoyl-CoA hydratase/carnithine racemase